MSKEKYSVNLKSLGYLGIDLWVKKNKLVSETDKNLKIHKNIIIQDTLNDKHKEIFKNFITAVKNSLENINIDFLDYNNLIELDASIDSDNIRNIYLIICNDDIKNIIQGEEYKEKYSRVVKNNIYTFNTFMVSENITDKIKKLLWKNFLYIKSYE